MAATVQIMRRTGASTDTDITNPTNTRLKQADNGTIDTNNPIPAVGTIDSNASVSCWCATKLQVVTTPPANGISNLKWYTDGVSLATGLKLKGEVATSYIQAVTSGLTFGGAGELKVANYSTITTPVDVIATYTSGAMKTVAGSIGNATGQIGTAFMVYQLQVASTASPGTTAGTTFTWQYDET